MAADRHPAQALAAEASYAVTMQDTAITILTQYAHGGAARLFTRPDARLVLDHLADLRRAAAAAGWLDEREAADNGEAA